MSKIWSAQIISQISETYKSGQKKALQAVNSTLVETYWKIGQYIVEFELKGADRATYGNKLIDTLAKDLFFEHGRGFSVSNINNMRLFYTQYPIGETLSRKLGWSHYFELLKIDNSTERLFYEKKSIQENWSIRELKRQKSASLYLRLAASKDKQAMLKSIEQEKRAFRPEDIVRDSNEDVDYYTAQANGNTVYSIYEGKNLFCSTSKDTTSPYKRDSLTISQ